MGRARVLIVMGTRPEAIKLAPVVAALARRGHIAPLLLVTGQHRTLIDSVLAHFDLRPDFDLDLMRPGQDAGDLTARAMLGVGEVLKHAPAEMVIVQGDTGSALGGALAGFHGNVPVAHIEAGLRTGDLASPFPEEGNRRLIGQIAALHFAPTAQARAALRREGIAARTIEVTGNTGIDALLTVDARVRGHARAPGLPELPADRPLVLVTTHRRENHGAPLMRICAGIERIARHEACEIVVPVHPNPAVARVLRSRLGGVAGVHLIEPLAYGAFVWAMRRAVLVLTDSGGVQEEAPVLGTPVLVLRDTTERPEGVKAGVAMLVGTDPTRIAGAARAVLRDADVARWMSRPLRLYGKGDAAPRIAARIAAYLRPGTELRAEAAVA
jgi:UDP-N-acetylglucosamine 2-epimerase (non-hydrolysing)